MSILLHMPWISSPFYSHMKLIAPVASCSCPSAAAVANIGSRHIEGLGRARLCPGSPARRAAAPWCENMRKRDENTWAVFNIPYILASIISPIKSPIIHHQTTRVLNTAHMFQTCSDYRIRVWQNTGKGWSSWNAWCTTRFKWLKCRAI